MSKEKILTRKDITNSNGNIYAKVIIGENKEWIEIGRGLATKLLQQAEERGENIYITVDERFETGSIFIE